MAVAQGTCPNCGAAVHFGMASSMAKVCEYCRATIVRSDRGLENLGKVADLAAVPSLIAVGDAGTFAGHPFEVAGRLQLDHGKGPWDEYYVSYSGGQSWGWLAYDEGNWCATSLMPECPLPPYASLSVEGTVPLGQYGTYTVAEVRQGKVVSAEGELPFPVKPDEIFFYADLKGPGGAVATLDYGDNTEDIDLFVGRTFAEGELQITQAGPRHVDDTKTQHIKCLSCAGDLPLMSGARAERLGCPYCGAVNDLAALQIVAQQERAFAQPEIPIATRGTFDGIEYIVIAYLRRSVKVEGERYPWEEYLLFAKQIGFRWVVKNEGNWMWSVSISAGDIDASAMPKSVTYAGKTFKRTSNGKARIDYVLGEVFWKCAVGEKVRLDDFACGKETMSRELSDGEVQWSHASPVPWPVLAHGFKLQK